MKVNQYINNTFHVNHVIYEKNDTKILLDGIVTKNNKNYYTSIPIDPVKFSFLCEKAIGYERTDRLWTKLFQNQDLVSEIIPKNHLGVELNFSNSEPAFNINQF
tara:strand:- start:131 stop:442 length:312 start_codon:yes stop_codon:yes gene_type:complete